MKPALGGRDKSLNHKPLRRRGGVGRGDNRKRTQRSREGVRVMNYIRELCLREWAAREHGDLREFHVDRRRILKSSDPGWQLYWRQLRRRHPHCLVEACPEDNYYAFFDLVNSVTPNAAVREFVLPTGVLDWKWMRREVMLEHFTTIHVIARRCGRPAGTVGDALRGLGGKPEYACHGLGGTKEQFWCKSWLTDSRLVSRLSLKKSRQG